MIVRNIITQAYESVSALNVAYLKYRLKGPHHESFEVKRPIILHCLIQRRILVHSFHIDVCVKHQTKDRQSRVYGPVPENQVPIVYRNRDVKKHKSKQNLNNSNYHAPVDDKLA